MDRTTSTRYAPASRLTLADGTVLAYHHTPASTAGGRLPGVMFLGGFKEDMTGTKAIQLEEFCRARGQQYTRFDYRGHGQSWGELRAATIGLCRSDASVMLDEPTTGPQILIDSS